MQKYILSVHHLFTMQPLMARCIIILYNIKSQRFFHTKLSFHAGASKRSCTSHWQNTYIRIVREIELGLLKWICSGSVS